MSGEDGGEVLPFPGGSGANDEVFGASLVAAVEALLFASGSPVTERTLCEALDHADATEVRAALALLGRQLEASHRGLELVQVAGGHQLRTDPRFAPAVLRLLGGKPQKLSRAALEVLAVVAYRQPATRADVEELRGVDSGGVLKTLADKGLLRVAGRREEPGRPLVYATTRAFLELFSLPDLKSLPSLRDLEEIAQEIASDEDGD